MTESEVLSLVSFLQTAIHDSDSQIASLQMIADAGGGAAVCSLRGSVPSLNVFLTEMLNLILCSEWVCVSGLGHWAWPQTCPLTTWKLLLLRDTERRYMSQTIRLHEIFSINRYESRH